MEKEKKLSEYSLEELKTELKKSADAWEFWKVQEISKELLDRGNEENAKIKFTEDQEAMLTKIKDKKANPKEMQDFIDNDIKNRKSETDVAIKNIQDAKDSKIKELEAQLLAKDSTIAEKNKEIIDKDSIKNILDGLPGLHDLSLETWGLLKIGKNLRDMEEKWTNSKDILVYCMAVTKRQILWTRTSIKRAYIKWLKKRKETSVVENDELEKIKDSLQPNANSKAKFKEALKKILLTTIEKQQKKHADEITEKITGKKTA